MAMAQTPLRRSVKLDDQVIAKIEAEMRARESYNGTLRRLLGLDREPGSQGARTDAPSAEPAQP